MCECLWNYCVQTSENTKLEVLFCVGLCYVMGLSYVSLYDVGVFVFICNGLGLEGSNCAQESNVGMC